MNRLCQVTGVSRAGYYRFRRRHESKAAAMELREQIQHIALRWSAYGYRRVHAELLRQGWKVNHKRVLRLMRIDNLLCVGAEDSFSPRTRDMVCLFIPT